MTDKIKYGQWIDNEGTCPSLTVGSEIQIEFNNKKRETGPPTDWVDWTVNGKNFDWSIKRYRIELSPEPSQETERSAWIHNTGVKPTISRPSKIHVRYRNGSKASFDNVEQVAWSIAGMATDVKKYRFEEFIASQETDSQGKADDWIAWNGTDGKCPIDPNIPTWVCLATTGVREIGERPRPAGEWNWAIDNTSRIIAYRTRIEPEVRTRSATVYVTSGTDEIFTHSSGTLDPDWAVKLTLTETNGKRSWEIEEVKP